MIREKKAAEIEQTLAKYPPERKRSAVMPLLYMAQEEYGYCSDEAIKEVADILYLDPTEVKSIAGFYSMYYEDPVGKHVIEVCDDLPCALKGADKFLSWCESYLEVKVGETTPDGKITLKNAMCLAACDRAPMCQVNLSYRYSLTEESFKQMVEALKNQ